MSIGHRRLAGRDQAVFGGEFPAADLEDEQPTLAGADLHGWPMSRVGTE
jgi:hypothetical protein